MHMTAPAAAKAPGGEKKYEPDENNTREDHGFLNASPSNGESGVHSDGGDHDVHLGAPVATATSLSLDGPHYRRIAGMPSG